ncbi:hypothetical protein GCM10010236_75640 [Streptomyces eurythermus]|nr:hypothetical protein GCM10010236_75640 [Streptomyces eurythermus]
MAVTVPGAGWSPGRAASGEPAARPGRVVAVWTTASCVQVGGDPLAVVAHHPSAGVDLVGTIGRAALGDLLPARRRQRVKARTRKHPTSKYGPNAGQHPHKAQNRTVRTTVLFFAHGLKSRS